MNSKPKVLTDNSSSKLEAGWNGLETTEFILNADTIVNPTNNNLVGNTLIINLPQLKDVNYRKLGRFNRLISRFPLKANDGVWPVKYELVPYDEVEFQMKEDRKPYSNKILNRFLLEDPDFVIEDDDRFLLGSDVNVGDYLTQIGYIIIKTIKS